MNEQKITEEVINGILVVTTETETETGCLRTYDGLIEAMEVPYRGRSIEQARADNDERNRRLINEHKELVARFVS